MLPEASVPSLKVFLADYVEPGSTVVTDGWPPYKPVLSGDYRHERHVAPGEFTDQLLPGVHRVASLLDRWLLGTHQGGVHPEHLRAYLDEFTFRFNRRQSTSPGLLFYRVLELAVGHDPVRYRQVVASPLSKKAPPSRNRSEAIHRASSGPGCPPVANSQLTRISGLRWIALFVINCINQS